MLYLSGINSFYGKAHILRDLKFEISAGEVVALLGRNGAGKTTTLKSIMQLVQPRSGSVKFSEHDITRLPPHKVAKLGIGYVPEERRIFTDLTVEENLEVGRQPERPGVPFWKLDMLFELFPNLKERRFNRGRELSGGEQQMLTIARTLIGNPQLLLLDEPSEGIAPVIVEQMIQTLLKIKSQGLTILLSEQNLHFAKLVADRVIVLESGVKRYDDTMQALASNPEIMQTYLAV